MEERTTTLQEWILETNPPFNCLHANWPNAVLAAAPNHPLDCAITWAVGANFTAACGRNEPYLHVSTPKGVLEPAMDEERTYRSTVAQAAASIALGLYQETRLVLPCLSSS